MTASELRIAFNDCLRYQEARGWLKPFLNPSRFVRNQLRTHGLIPGRLGETRRVRAFHLPEFTIVNGDTVSVAIGSYGIYEPSLTGAFLGIVEPGQVVVDIGMHLGYYATLFARLVGPNGAVHAFEPTPATREIAAENVQQFRNITVHPVALWSSAGKLTLHDFGRQWMAFNSFTGPRMKSGPPPPKEFVAETTTLDMFRRQLGRRIALVKIDAESAETEILKGAQELLKLDKPLVSLEVGDAEDDLTSRHLVDYLCDRDYRAWDFCAKGFTQHQKRTRYEYDNLIFAPADRGLAGH